jgi:ribosome-binding factor A
MKKILLSAFTILFIIPVMAQETANLKMSLEKNKLYRLKSVSEQTITQMVNGNQQTVESKVEYTLSVKMLDVTPDFMVTEVYFDTLITNTNSMGKTVTINSTLDGNLKSSETGDIMSCIMNRLSKSALFVKMDFTGKPVEVVNAKMLSDMILKDTASITLAEPLAAAMKTQAAGTISDNSLKAMIGSFTWHLPGKQVSVGDEWKITEQTNSGGMLLAITTTYHLDRINENNADITVESNIKAAENAPPIQSGGATVTYDNLTGMSKSNLMVDVRTGLVVEDKVKTHISGNLSISAPGFSMQMPMDINGETKVKAL